MTRLTYLVRSIVLGLGIVTAFPSLARAQPAVAPAFGVRVVEVVDPTSGATSRRVAEDLTPAEIARVQRTLASAGFVTGRATGRLTAETRTALGRFQSARGLVPCECVSYETVVALGIRPVVVAVIRAPLVSTRSRTLVVLPGSRVRRGQGSAITVGHSPSVSVGLAPARGAGGARPAMSGPPLPPPSGRAPALGSGASLRSLSPGRPTATPSPSTWERPTGP